MDETAVSFNGQLCLDGLPQLFRHKLLHVVEFSILVLVRIQVEPSTGTKVPIFIFSINSGPSRGCIGEDDGNAVFGSRGEEVSLLSTSVFRAGQSGEAVRWRN
jgi:hypothetical protein